MPSLIPNGDTVPLSLQLEDGATGKFPQAEVIDQTGAPIVGSPFDLTHRNEGLYTSTSLTMGAQDALHVSYIVYDDAGHTTESDEHARATDVFHSTPGLVTDVQESILSDATQFAGANIDAAISSVLSAIAALNDITAADVLNEDVTGREASPDSLGRVIDLFNKLTRGRIRTNPTLNQLELYDPADDTLLLTWPLTDFGGEPISNVVGAPFDRAKAVET